MSEPFIGEIRMFAGNFVPRDWAYCDGQLLPISQNNSLFSLFGTTYGGDGRTTFGLPELRGRIPVHQGSGPGLSPRRLGSRLGSETETLSLEQIPNHNHDINANPNDGNQNTANGNVLAKAQMYRNDGKDTRQMYHTAIDNTGGSQPHSNLQPTLCINYIVALAGIYPPRN